MSTGALFSWQSNLPHSVEDVFTWHQRPGAFERLNAPWRPVSVKRASDGINEGAAVEIALPLLGPLAIPWILRHTLYAKNSEFVDEQERGPFVAWRHRHIFKQQEGGTRLEDAISYALPWWGRPFNALLQKELRRLFSYRHAVLATDLNLHARHRTKQRKLVLIAGASGFVGTALSAFLSSAGHTVFKLVRHSPKRGDERFWNPERGELDPKALEGIDVVINLCGANIAQSRWTQRRKAEIAKSRVSTAGLLAKTISSLSKPPELAIMASAVGFYGASDAVCDEGSSQGSGFLADVSAAWESAGQPISSTKCRLVHLRMGTVLNAGGGALRKMLPAFRFGFGGPLGTGSQWMSWIALQDLLGLVEHTIFTPDISGPVNAVAPEPCTNRVFSKVLAKVLRRPAVVRAPSNVLRFILGEMGQSLLLASSRVTPRVAIKHGYTFILPSLEEALRFEMGVCL